MVRAGQAHGAVGSLLQGDKAVNMHPHMGDGVFRGVRAKKLSKR
jgi:hypothetical protein